MALVNPFQTSPVFRLSHPPAKQNSPPVLLYSLSSHPFKQLSARGKHARCGAMADVKASPSLDNKDEEDHKVLVGPSSEEELRGERVVDDYDWTEEWYPLYLTQNVPDDAPLGLKVFDKQLVLYKDGNGDLHCYEDRCPHRKWMDRAGHGMPYHFGHSTISLPKEPAVVEHAPAGLVAGLSASLPAKGGIGSMHAPNLANRYFRHVIHCKECRSVVKAFQTWKNALSAVTVAMVALAILATGRQWKALVLASASICAAGAYACSTLQEACQLNKVLLQ